ncbi:MAG TPA: VOC family protein [Pyrinomonadaceae bacterium]|nr:VOC family protein [Pyrinomonadaceae bacterium]
MAKIEQRITPMLWFDNQAEEAANYYVSIFKNSKVTNVSRYGDTGPGPKGSVMVAEFELDGQKFTALNGGPRFKFTEAISLVVNCENQEEVDYYWEKLSGDGGEEVVCGWLKDKYGLSWQVCPVKVFELLSDPATSDRVMAAVMEMKKIDLSKIEQAVAARAGA